MLTFAQRNVKDKSYAALNKQTSIYIYALNELQFPVQTRCHVNKPQQKHNMM